ncbi:hypothetical protein JCM10908_006839 [Rhodotorula pacifica]|uniref:SDR family oxidoreductase n=1 Tax=Rhodotorula pacifica TaxID=1495444 RepID=UPI0031715F45
MSPTVYFVTGASRGIGFALVEQLSERDNVLIFAGARIPSTADKLNALVKSAGEGKIVVVKLDSTSDEDAKEAAKVVQAKTDKVDVLIANAGDAFGFGPIHQLSSADFLRGMDINAAGPLRIFSALAPLLFKSPSPKVIGISSSMGSLTLNADPSWPAPPALGYSASKTALNMVFARIHAENYKEHNMTAFVVCPGHTQTDLGNRGAKEMGQEAAPVKLEDSIKGVLGLVDEESGKYAGKFMSYDGAERPW